MVQYDIAVLSGAIAFTIEDPDGEVIYDTALTESHHDTFSFTVEKSGRYRFVVEGEKAEGEFLVEWDRVR